MNQDLFAFEMLMLETGEGDVFLSCLKDASCYFSVLLWIKRTTEGQHGNSSLIQMTGFVGGGH